MTVPTASKISAVTLFRDKVIGILNRFKNEHLRYFSVPGFQQRQQYTVDGKKDFDSYANQALKNLFHSIQVEYDLLVKQHSSFSTWLKEFKDNDGHPIGKITFPQFWFCAPLEWHNVCPVSLQGIAVCFEQCAFPEGFFLHDTKNIGDIHFLGTQNNPPLFDFKNIHLDNLYFTGNATHQINVMQNVKANGLIHFDNIDLAEICCRTVVAEKGFHLINSNCRGVFKLAHCHLKQLDLSETKFVKNNTSNISGYDGATQWRAKANIQKSFIGFFIQDNCLFEKIASFKEAKFFIPVNISDTKFLDDVVFNNCEFDDTTLFKNVIFSKSPKFHKAILHQDTDFSAASFIDFTSETAHRDYSTLKHLMLGLNAEIEAHRFHSYELKSRYNTVLKKWNVEKITSWLFKELSDYHQDLLRPFKWLLVFASVMAFVYVFNDAVNCTETALKNNAWLNDYVCINPTWRNVVFSLQQTLSPLAFIFQSDLWSIRTPIMKFVSFVHILSSGLIMFLLILGIRKRFKI